MTSKNQQQRPLLVTASIPYVNARPHIGHVLEFLQADVVARYSRGLGRQTHFLIGTDENSLKNVQAAKKAGQSIQDFVDEQAEHFRATQPLLNLSNDDFIRTSEARHVAGAQKFWQAFAQDDLYKKAYRGLYCVGCEEFKLEKDLVADLCPIHQTQPEIVEEENWFFRLSRYQQQLDDLISADKLTIEPDFRKNEVLAFIRGGLEDLSISRSVVRAQGWGVPVPGDPGQIMYVWVDALSNYITALDYTHEGELYQKFWAGESDRLHMIGKDITRFHAMYWPAFLLSAGLQLPTAIQVHEFFMVDGQKMSKSLGNVIGPEELVTRYGLDATRYLLLASLPGGRDGDVGWAKFDTRYTADLCNGLGNLLQRTLVLRQKFDVSVPEGSRPSCAAADEATETYHFARALEEIWKLVAHANEQLESEKPWSETDALKRAQTLTSVTRQLETIAMSLGAYLPATSAAILDQLASGKPEPLFPRLAA